MPTTHERCLANPERAAMMPPSPTPKTEPTEAAAMKPPNSALQAERPHGIQLIWDARGILRTVDMGSWGSCSCRTAPGAAMP